MPSRAPQSPQGPFIFALRQAIDSLCAPGLLASACSQAEAIAELALASPESAGDFSQWVFAMSLRSKEARALNEAGPYAFVEALCEAISSREQAWLDLALERAADSNAVGLLAVFQALFLPAAASAALKTARGSSSALPRWERSRAGVIGAVMDLLPEELARSVRELALAGPLSQPELTASLVNPTLGATPGSMALFFVAAGGRRVGVGLLPVGSQNIARGV